jgi:hypothetical protein
VENSGLDKTRYCFVSVTIEAATIDGVSFKIVHNCMDPGCKCFACVQHKTTPTLASLLITLSKVPLSSKKEHIGVWMTRVIPDVVEYRKVPAGKQHLAKPSHSLGPSHKYLIFCSKIDESGIITLFSFTLQVM